MINIGMDVHKKTCVVTVKGNTPKILEQTEFLNTRGGITTFAKRVKRKYKGQAIKAVCESTGNYWMILHDTLEDHGIDTLLAHPAKIKAIAQAKLKDDKIDSAILADLLRMDMVYESFVPDKYHRDLRSLSRDRIGMTRAGTREKNRITATMVKYDYKSPTKNKFGRQGIESLRNADVSKIDKMSLNARLDMIEMAARHRSEFEGEIARICEDDPRAKLLMTVPGISHVTAMGILSGMVDMRRFSTADKLAAYAGITPSHRNSGETFHSGGITRTGSTWLRYALVNAATVAVRFDDRMKERYERVGKRRGRQKAKVAVARTLAVVIWHMLTGGTEYRTQNRDLTQRKHKRMERLTASSD